MSYTVRTISALTTELNANITDNVAKLNTAARVRAIVGDLTASSINRLDDKALLNLRVFDAGRPGGYEVGEGTLYDDEGGYAVYRCTTAHTGAWNAGHFEAVNAVVGAAGGDLSGTYPNPTVSKINGVDYNADPLAQYALLAGRAGGQTLKGGNALNEDFILKSNSTGTPGNIILEDVVICSTLTANKLVSSNGSSELVSSTYSESDFDNLFGAWTNVTFDASDFTASSGTWTVNTHAAASVGYSYRYKVLGKTLYLQFYSFDSTLSDPATTLHLKLPGSYSAKVIYVGFAESEESQPILLEAAIAQNGTTIDFIHFDGTNYDEAIFEGLAVNLIMEIN